jgi:glutamate 5-kinase
MASKLAAAKIASWSGVRTVIAAAARADVVAHALSGEPGVGTVVQPHDRHLPARKLWIAFAVGARGTITVDAGARTALGSGGASLLHAGVRAVDGTFEVDDPVEIADEHGTVFAKGLVQFSSSEAARLAGQRSADLPDGASRWLVHCDDLVMLP